MEQSRQDSDSVIESALEFVIAFLQCEELALRLRTHFVPGVVTQYFILSMRCIVGDDWYERFRLHNITHDAHYDCHPTQGLDIERVREQLEATRPAVRVAA